MSGFDEGNTIEAAIREVAVGYDALPWAYVHGPDLPRGLGDVFVEPWLVESLVALNPALSARPERAEEVVHKLRAYLQAPYTEGLVRANERFAEWLLGEHSLPIGEDHEHVTIKLVDYERPERNRYAVSQQVTYRPKPGVEKRFDLVFWVNGLPLAVAEVKTPVRPAITWADGATDFLDDYWKTAAPFFVPNVLCLASEGKELRVAPVGADYRFWAPWRETEDRDRREPGMDEVMRSARLLLRPHVVLRLLRAFHVFSTTDDGKKVKVLARYPQVEAALQIRDRVVDARVRKGLIWHFQGSGKSLLMLFAARLLKAEPALHNPTVIVVVDRTDLDTQIGGTFDAADVAHTVRAGSRKELETLLRQGTRQIIITTIHKFGEAEGVLNARDNVVVLVDEAHRTQEGDLGRRMRDALPNAFFFGLTGTPIAKRDRNTFALFGAEEDEGRFLNHYSYRQSIRDEATLPVRFEPRLLELRIDRDALDAEFDALAEEHGLSETERATLSQKAGKMAHLLKAPARMAAIADDVVQHFTSRIEPSGLKGMVVVYDREACVVMKRLLDERLPDGMETEVVMHTETGDLAKWRDAGVEVDDEDYARWQAVSTSDAAQEALLDRYRDPSDPLQLLVVTSKLLTGFDAPICGVMYLDKPLRDHNLLQAMCRTNRLYPDKSQGLVVDYLGVFDNLAKALDYDPKEVEGVVESLAALKGEFPAAIEAALAHFPGVDRTLTGFEGLLAAQEAIRGDERRDAFAADFTVVARMWEALTPDPFLQPYADDYRWLAQVYESVRPTSGLGRLLWHSLGPKTLDLIHQHVDVRDVRTDLDDLVVDADVVLELTDEERSRRGQEILQTIRQRLGGKKGDPRFEALSERLERLRERYETGVMESLEWLKELLDLARDVVKTEQETDVPLVPDDKQALSQIFEEARVETTPEVVGRIVDDIDEVVRATRFEGWQTTVTGEREIQKVLRRTLLKYKLHTEQDLFDRAYAYVRQHY